MTYSSDFTGQSSGWCDSYWSYKCWMGQDSIL